MKIYDEENTVYSEDDRDFEMERIFTDAQTSIYRLADRLAESYECITPYEQLALLNIDLFG